MMAPSRQGVLQGVSGQKRVVEVWPAIWTQLREAAGGRSEHGATACCNQKHKS
jgi:hypothetical protein